MTNFQKVSQWLKDNCDVDVKLGQTTAYIGGSTRTIFIHHNYNLEKNGLISIQNFKFMLIKRKNKRLNHNFP